MRNIRKKFWSFGEEIMLEPTTSQFSFLFWKWERTYTPTQYKYKNAEAVLDEVNKFINENNINEILSFKDTSRTVRYMDYDVDYVEREGGIELVYMEA